MATISKTYTIRQTLKGSIIAVLAVLTLACPGLNTDELTLGDFLPKPEIKTVFATSDTTIQLIFADEMKRSGLGNTGNYSIIGAGNLVVVEEVTVVEGSSNKIINLRTSEQTSESLYRLIIKNIQTAAGRSADSGGISGQFTGYILTGPGLKLSASALQIVEGNRAELAVALNSEPNAPVTVSFTIPEYDTFDSFDEELLQGLSFEDEDGNPLSELTFTPADFDQSRTVRINFADNELVHSTLFATLQLASMQSSDPEYSGLLPQLITLTIIEDTDFLPTAAALSPFAGQTNYPLTSPFVQIQFSKTMAEATVNTGNIKVYDITEDPRVEVSGEILYGSLKNTATFTFDDYAKGNNRYRVELSGTITDSYGNFLNAGEGAAWEFETGDWSVTEKVGINIDDLTKGSYVRGQYAYVAKEDANAVLIYDISDPDIPLLKGSFTQASMEPVDMYATDDLLYIADELGDRLTILHISDQDCPMVLVDGVPPAPCATIAKHAEYTQSFAVKSVQIEGNWAYMATGEGFKVVDTTCGVPPCVLSLAAEYDHSGVMEDAVIEGDYAYIANRYGASGELLVVDLTNKSCGSPPCALTLHGNVATPERTYNLDLHDGLVAMTMLYDGFQLVDVSDPANPGLLQAIDPTVSTSDVAIVYPYMAVLATDYSDTSYITLFDIADINNPFEIGQDSFSGLAEDFAVNGSRISFAGFNETTDTSRFYVVDIPPQQPVRTSNSDLGFLVGTEVRDDYLFAADLSGAFKVIDISLPTSPSEVASVALTPGGPAAIALDGNTAWVAMGSEGLQAIDITDPAVPSAAGSVDTGGMAQGLAIRGNYAYVGDDASVEVVDISDASSPQIVGSYAPSGGNAGTMTIDGSTLYVALGTGGFDIVDLADPENPAFVGNYASARSVSWVSITGSTAVITSLDVVSPDDITGYIETVDISTPATPVQFGETSVGQTTAYFGGYISGDYYFHGGSESGNIVFDISDVNNPEAVASPAEGGHYFSVTGDDNYLYGFSQSGEFDIIYTGLFQD